MVPSIAGGAGRYVQSSPNRTPPNKKVQPKRKVGCTPSKPFTDKGCHKIQARRAYTVALGIFPYLKSVPPPYGRALECR